MLIAVQVGASALLLICAVIFLRGAFAAATRDPGVRISDTLRVSIEAEARRAAILQDLRTDPLVALVAASSRPTRGAIETSVSPSRMSVDQLAVSSDYFTVLGLDLVSGQGWTGFGVSTCRPAPRSRGRGYGCASGAPPSRRDSRCSNASPASIPRLAS
jgi:hypothetical protein